LLVEASYKFTHLISYEGVFQKLKKTLLNQVVKAAGGLGKKINLQ